METFFEQVYTILTIPPGNLAYHLVLALSAAGALQNTVLMGTQPAEIAHRRRLFAGLLLLLAGQVALFTAGGLAWQGLADPHTLLPPLDHAVTFFSLVTILWLWAVPRPVTWQDALCGFLVVLAAASLFLSWNSWASAPQDLSFNSSWLGWTWEIASLSICLASLLYLLLRRVPGWGLGAATFAVLLIGHASQLAANPTGGDYPGLVRLAQFAAFPLLLALPHLSLLPERQSKSEAASQETAFSGSPRYPVERRALESFLAFASTEKGQLDPAGITRAIALLTRADRCYLATRSGQEGVLEFSGGYDTVQDAALPGFRPDPKSAGVLTGVLDHAEFLQLDPGSGANPLEKLAETMGLAQLDSLLFVPVEKPGQPAAGAILLVSTASNREWTVEDQEYLAPVAAFLAGCLDRTEEPAPVQGIEKVSSEASSAWQREAGLAAVESSIAGDLPENPTVEAQKDLIAVMAVQQELQAAINRLQNENEKLKDALGQANRQVGIKTSHLIQREAAVQDALAELERLRIQLAKVEAANQALSSKNLTEDLVAAVESIVQELHHPVDSIDGYIDLLLGESMGNIGPLQKKFLDRIKTAALKASSLLEDLTLAVHQEEELGITVRNFDLRKVIDRALEFTGPQRAEKKIAVLPDLPEAPAVYSGEPDVIQQIAIHLLQNAASVTPTAGAIIVAAGRSQAGEPDPCLLMQVTDAGGGIRPEDLPGVFSPEVRDVPIQGIGDNGADLCVAKALAESLGGRIWIENEAAGSTVSVLIPVQDGVDSKT